jgi:hypothetical protein
VLREAPVKSRGLRFIWATPVAELIEEAVLVLYVQPEEKRAMREARAERRKAAGRG